MTIQGIKPLLDRVAVVPLIETKTDWGFELPDNSNAPAIHKLVETLRGIIFALGPKVDADHNLKDFDMKEQKEFKRGDKIKLNRKESDLMSLLEAAIRVSIGEFTLVYKKELTEIHGGFHNALITVLGKLYSDLIAMAVATTHNDMEASKKAIIQLLSNQMDEDYKTHIKEMQKNDGTN